MKYNPLTRRMFLQGLGSTLAIPLLPSLLPKAHAAAVLPPPRFAMILSKFGRDMSQWYPKIPDSSLSQVNGAYAIPFSQIPKPISYSIGDSFNPVLNKISLLRGLDALSTQGNHNSSLPTTGSSVDPSTSVGFGYSIDCVLEESQKFYTSLPTVGALRVCPDISYPFSEFASYSFTSKTTRGQIIAPDWNPLQVYNRLLDPASIQSRNEKNVRLRNVTDLVMENYKEVMSGRSIGAEDKQRLDNYMSLLSDTHKQLAIPAALCGQANTPGNPVVLNEIHKAMLKIEVAALACGITRITMHSILHPGDVAEPLWHQWAHGGEYSVNSATGRSYISEFSKYNMDLVAYFLTQLDQVTETNGTLLDNTLFIYGNEDGTGSHEHFDLPVLVAGGQGKLRLGEYIDYRVRPWVPLIKREKASINAGRPYNNMLVTAFQTLGLSPADYQKFGEQGFGKYDKPSINAGTHYNQFLGAKVNDPLPYLWKG